MKLLYNMTKFFRFLYLKNYEDIISIIFNLKGYYYLIYDIQNKWVSGTLLLKYFI
jgi:hypothetical protein